MVTMVSRKTINILVSCSCLLVWENLRDNMTGSGFVGLRNMNISRFEGHEHILHLLETIMVDKSCDKNYYNCPKLIGFSLGKRLHIV
jgi:hypothetical protein